MKKAILSMMFAISVWAVPYTVGQSVSPLELEDQHGNHTTLKAMPKTLIMAYEKGTGATVNEYLNTQDKGYLKKIQCRIYSGYLPNARFGYKTVCIAKNA